MRILRFFLPAAVLLLAFAAGATAKEPWESKYEQEGWVRLDAKEIKAAMFDATLSPDGKGYQVYIAPDGSMKFKSMLGWSDVGKAELKPDGTLCRQWEQLRSGKQMCVTVWKKGTTYLTAKEDGTIYRTLLITRGNTANL